MAVTTKIYTPEEAAEVLRLSVGQLIRLIHANDFAYSNLMPSGNPPWGPGKEEWRLSEEQLQVIILGQTRRPPPKDATPAKPAPMNPAKRSPPATARPGSNPGSPPACEIRIPPVRRRAGSELSVEDYSRTRSRVVAGEECRPRKDSVKAPVGCSDRDATKLDCDIL